MRTAVESADVICTATNSSTPLFDGAWLRPGTHINGIGSYTRTMRELDTTTMLRSRVYVDGRTRPRPRRAISSFRSPKAP